MKCSGEKAGRGPRWEEEGGSEAGNFRVWDGVWSISAIGLCYMHDAPNQTENTRLCERFSGVEE